MNFYFKIVCTCPRIIPLTIPFICLSVFTLFILSYKDNSKGKVDYSKAIKGRTQNNKRKA